MAITGMELEVLVPDDFFSKTYHPVNLFMTFPGVLNTVHASKWALNLKPSQYFPDQSSPVLPPTGPLSSSVPPTRSHGNWGKTYYVIENPAGGWITE